LQVAIHIRPPKQSADPCYRKEQIVQPGPVKPGSPRRCYRTVTALPYGRNMRMGYIITLESGEARQLTSMPGNVRCPAWSPDGEWIAFLYTDKILASEGATGWKLYAIRPDGTGLYRIRTEHHPHCPQWAPLPGLALEGVYRVTEAGAGLHLRAAPWLAGDSVRQLRQGLEMQVLEGPLEMDSYLWWRVRLLDRDQEGWVAETPGWFVPRE
jgi:hypothetical protein